MSAWTSRARAVLRLAVRDAVRGRGRSTLIALMVLVPVMLTTAGAVVARSAVRDPQDVALARLGTGQIQARVFGSFDGDPVEQDVTADSTSGGDSGRNVSSAEVEQRLREVVGPRDRLERAVYGGDRALAVGSDVVRADVGELDLTALGPNAPVALASGRAPAADGEVLAWDRGRRGPLLAVGTRFTIIRTAAGPGRTYTVVGTFRATDSLGLAEVLGRAGEVVDPADAARKVPFGTYGRGWFVVGPDPVSWAQVRQINAFGGFVVSRAAIAEDPPQARANPTFASVGPQQVVSAALAVSLLLLQIMLMVGPAIAVGARRNERLLAVVAASGGAPGHLAGFVLAGSAVIGLLAATAGAALGVAAATVVVRVLDAETPGSMPRVDVHALDLVGLVLAGALTAVAAASLPARRVARLDVVASLTGRRSQSGPRLRIPMAGAALAVGGIALAWWGAGQDLQWVLLLGITVAEIGLVLATSAVVALFGRLAGRLPVSARFALRDAARQRGRTVPAVAATIAAVAAGVAMLVLGASQDDLSRRMERQEVATGTGYVRLLAADSGMSQLPLDPVLAAARSTLGATPVGVGYAVPYEFDSSTSKDVTVRLPDICNRVRGCTSAARAVRFVDPQAAALLAPDAEQARAAVAAGKAVVWDRALLGSDGTVTLTVTDWADDGRQVRRTVPAVLADGPTKLTYVVVPRSAAPGLGVTVVPNTVYLRPGPEVSAVDLARFDAALANVDPTLTYSVQDANPRDVESTVYFLLALIAAAAALAGTFIAVGLAAADARGDLGTLAAVGADPAVRRRVGAGQAAAIVVPGALVGGLAGVVTGAALVRLVSTNFYDDVERWRLVVPPVGVGLLVLGVPALAIALGWLTVRSRLEVVRRLGE